MKWHLHENAHNFLFPKDRADPGHTDCSSVATGTPQAVMFCSGEGSFFRAPGRVLKGSLLGSLALHEVTES